MNIKKKMLLITSGLAIIPLTLSIFLLETIATQEASDALYDVAKRQLISIRDIKKTQIEDYFSTIRGQVITLSSSSMIIDAMREFKSSYSSVKDNADIDMMRTQLADYYENQFGAEYKKLNTGKQADTRGYLNNLDADSIALQYHYIQANKNPLGSKHKLDAADDGSTYSKVHNKFHPPIRQYLEEFEYYDIFLVDHKTGNIIYSVYKELDYTTSLLNGSYANSGMGKVFRQANKLNKDGVAIVDFEPYSPSYEGAASFIASPVFENGQKTGILIFQMPIGRINAAMTSGEKWKDIGLGDSGETYLVGSDFKARSISRFLIEDKKGFVELMNNVGVDNKVVAEISAKGTNIGLQKIETRGTKAALAGKKDFEIFPDYRNVNVLSAYTPLNIPGLKWALMSEIDEEEAFAATSHLTTSIIKASLIIFIVIAVVSLGLGIFFANGITSPISRLRQVMNDVEVNKDLTLRSDVNSKDEIGEMAHAFNTMLHNFEGLIKQVVSTSTQLATAAEEVSAVASDSAQNVERQHVETDMVATAINEMTATVQEVAQNAQNASSAATNADTESKTGKHVVTNTSQAIVQLLDDVENAAKVIQNVEQASETIGTVLDVIKNIAEQTNLLALNAAIEAARAGEQGRGFAVVADEVRTLASRTQQSTAEIENMIMQLQDGAKQAVDVMDKGSEQAKKGAEMAKEAADSLNAITQAVSTISEMNTQIAAAAEEQSAVSEEINRSIVKISELSQQTASGAEQTTGASAELARLASDLQAKISMFKVNT
ncbi:MAG: methyl-accepting chemotaxis protein [Gammaproteobacteria bacterium]|nr:methyl-accepting chemotaxis protein [Gammaproteobacteria bacterium]